MFEKCKSQPILYILAFLGCLFVMTLLLSINKPSKEIEVIKEVEKIVYQDRIEYININVFVSKMHINSIIEFYKENIPKEYVKILEFYDRYTKSRIVTKTIIEQSIKIGVPVHMAMGLVERESRFNPNAENRNTDKSWDRGLFQLNSASRPKWKKNDYFNVEKNVIEGLSCLKWLLEEFPSNDLSVAAYNAGYGSVTRRVIPYTTAIHVFEIKNNETKYDIAFNTKLLPTLSNIEYSEGQFKLIP